MYSHEVHQKFQSGYDFHVQGYPSMILEFKENAIFLQWIREAAHNLFLD